LTAIALWTALLLALAAGYFWMRGRAGPHADEGSHSLAVLPFQPLAGSTDDDHLGLGVADAVITKLSNVRQLPVRPTDVVIRYADPKVDPLQAARELGVDSVLTGKIQKSGDRIRVTVQLVRVRDGRPLWAQSFDEQTAGIFAVEDSISEKVVQALALNLAAQEKRQLDRHYTENIDAYRNYLEGRYSSFQFTREGMNKAIEYFNHAIASDPGYALAYAGLADAYTTESDWLLAPRDALPKAEAAARKALAFDDSLAEAHGALAHALLHEWRLPESDREFHIALALNPSNVSTYFAYGEYLASVGKPDQAIAAGRKALAIDPLSPEINSFMAWDYYLARDYPQCQATSSRAMQMFPEFWVPHMMAGMCYYVTQQFAQSLDEYKKALAMNPESTFAQAGIGMCQASMGNRAGALKALDDLKAMAAKTYVSPGYVALIYHALGDRDTEYTWLEKGYDDEAEWLLFLPKDPMYDGQHNDPRFKALIRKVGLTQ
jgi:TolB-like protein/Flp pilus assembly protein TadD